MRDEEDREKEAEHLLHQPRDLQMLRPAAHDPLKLRQLQSSIRVEPANLPGQKADRECISTGPVCRTRAHSTADATINESEQDRPT